MARTQLYPVRHGEQGSASDHEPDEGLSQLGRDQADRLGRRLRTVPFSAVHHSPLARPGGPNRRHRRPLPRANQPLPAQTSNLKVRLEYYSNRSVLAHPKITDPENLSSPRFERAVVTCSRLVPGWR